MEANFAEGKVKRAKRSGRNKGRIYDPVLARFLSADIVVQMPNAITSYNRYGYVMNNPLIYTDPSGYFIAEAIALIWAMVQTAAPYIAATAATAAAVAAATGHLTAARRLVGVALMFSGIYMATGASAAEAAWWTVGTAFASGGIQSGSLEGAVLAGITAGAGMALAPAFEGIITGLDSALNNAFASNAAAYTVNSGGYLAHADGTAVSYAATAGGVPQVVERVEIFGKNINWATDVPWTATPQGMASVGIFSGMWVTNGGRGASVGRARPLGAPPMPSGVPKNLKGFANPKEIKFVQDSAREAVTKIENGKEMVTPNSEIVEALKTNRLSPHDLEPIRVFEHEGQIYTMDHNRLLIANEANVPVKIVPASQPDIDHAKANKWTNPGDGTFIGVRNQYKGKWVNE